MAVLLHPKQLILHRSRVLLPADPCVSPNLGSRVPAQHQASSPGLPSLLSLLPILPLQLLFWLLARPRASGG